ncbi:MAG: four helix bundle protein [Candidatus Saccharimonadales bacterium]
MNSFQEKSAQLEERLMNFALSIITATKTVPLTTENKIIISQLIRSATSVGANYAEANNAISKQDFRNKIFIAKKEAAETKYWLTLLARVNDSVFRNELQEAQQILMILQKIVSTLKNGK